LHDPKGISGAGEYKLLDILDISENLDSLALVQSCRLHKPNVILAVLERQPLLFRSPIVNLLESIHKLRYFMVVWVARDQKCGRCAIKNLVTCLECLLIILVILFETPNKASLGA
jgi:hypothetical protein